VSYLTTPGKVKLKLSTKGRVCVEVSPRSSCEQQ
jgi:hypothetical protein